MQRRAIFLKSESAGYGAMMEAIFSYNVTPHWKSAPAAAMGLEHAQGHRQNQLLETFGQGVPTPGDDNYDTDRYGVFIQSGYHWGDTTRPASTGEDAFPS